MSKNLTVPTMPSLQKGATLLHSVISQYPSWPTARQVNSNAPWSGARRTDIKDQLERRSPHWPNIPSDQQHLVLRQIKEVASVFEELEGYTEKDLPIVRSDDTTHIYLRHGVTIRQLGSHSDIDLVAVKKGLDYAYDEELIKGPIIYGSPRMWHVGFIGFDELFNGNEPQALHVKIDLYRGVCIFGDDFFSDNSPPPSLMWLCFLNQLSNNIVQYLFNTQHHPEDFWQAKAVLRAREVLDILRNLNPDLSANNLIQIVEKGRGFSVDDVFDYIDPVDKRLQEIQKEILTLMWETYHHLGYSFDQE